MSPGKKLQSQRKENTNSSPLPNSGHAKQLPVTAKNNLTLALDILFLGMRLPRVGEIQADCGELQKEPAPL